MTSSRNGINPILTAKLLKDVYVVSVLYFWDEECSNVFSDEELKKSDAESKQ